MHGKVSDLLFFTELKIPISVENRASFFANNDKFQNDSFSPKNFGVDEVELTCVIYHWKDFLWTFHK